jgi:hypothetical protein
MDKQPENPNTGFSIPREHYEQLRAQQSLGVALFAGIGAAIVGGIAWAAVTVTADFQIGYMALAVGFLVGFAVRLGNGIDKIFGVLGATFSLVGCLLGNILSAIIFLGKQDHLGLSETFSKLDYSRIPEVFTASFSLMDLLFYGLAVYEGYRFSFRRITPADVAPSSGAA